MVLDSNDGNIAPLQIEVGNRIYNLVAMRMKRNGVMQLGLKDTGQYVKEGIGWFEDWYLLYDPVEK